MRQHRIDDDIQSYTDFEYEENLYAAYKTLKPDVNIIHIFCDSQYNFISSTLLRNYGHLPQFNQFIVK